MPDASGLEPLGYSPRWEALFAPYESEHASPARVIRANRGSVLVATSTGVRRAKVSSALRKATASPVDMPAVGDWVVIVEPPGTDVPLIEAVLERASAIKRGDAGDPAAIEVLAANVDTVFIVHPIDEPPNLRRIERELSLAWDSGAVPVVVLTKADLTPTPGLAREAAQGVALGVEVELTSARAGEGVEALLAHVTGHRTAVLIGPSGAGKSTLVNSLLGEERQRTREVSTGGRGRHTTVARELVELPGGGLLIDTPGLRSLALTGSDSGIAATFPDVEEAAASCRFRDCTHNDEPGCAVQAAVAAGTLPIARLRSYHKLKQEADHAAVKTVARVRAQEAGKGRPAPRAGRDDAETGRR